MWGRGPALSYQNFAAEVTKLGAGDEIRRFDGTTVISDQDPER